nr:hypothetical protein [Euzebya tangerina]
MVAPRRFGKTSLLRRLDAELAETVTTIFVDLYQLRSWADLAARLDDGLSKVTTEHRAILEQIAAGFEINLGFVKASLTGRKRDDGDLTADRLLDVVITMAQRTPTLLILDEFSSIVRVDGAAGLLRTKLQQHFDEVGLIFAGSEPSTMRMLFSDTDQPFYAQADLLNLGGLDRHVVQEVVSNGFAGRPPRGLAAKILQVAGGHPQRTMQLADAAWRLRNDIDDDDELWELALGDVRDATADGFELRFAELSSADQAVLRLVASDSPLFGNTAALLGLSASSADRARKSLVGSGQLDTDEDGLSVVDPFFGDWIRTRFSL